jgi:hypothetical protein
LTYLLFLKMDEERVRDWGEESAIPEGFNWASLRDLEGVELESHDREILLELGKGAGLISVIFRKAQNRIQNPARLKRLIELIDAETVRRKLLHECDVHTLLRLPSGVFYAQGVKANVLFFDRSPGSPTAHTKTLWIHDLRTNKSFTLKQNPLTRADLGVCGVLQPGDPARADADVVR